MLFERRLRRFWFFLVRLQREMAYDDAMGMAAQISYYTMLALFPFLIFVLSLLGTFPLGESLQPMMFDALREQMPVEAANYVTDIVINLLPDANRGLLSIGLLASLWGASMAVGALITTINRAYNIRPRRHFLTQKLLSIVLTLALDTHIEEAVILSVTLALGLHLWRELSPGYSVRHEGHTLYLELKGVLWFGSAPILEKALLEPLGEAQDATRIVLDLGGLGRIDVTGALALKRLREDVERAGLQLELTDVPAPAGRMLQQVMDWKDSEEDHPGGREEPG